jgi:soluble cytochrome b562
MEAEIVKDLMKSLVEEARDTPSMEEEVKVEATPIEPKEEVVENKEEEYVFDLEEELKDYDEGLEKLLAMTEKYGFP